MVLGLAVAVSGCGSDNEEAATTTSAAESTADWADGLCRSLDTWKSSLTSATNEVTGGGITKANLEEAKDGITSANSELQDDLDALGTPPTPAASDAKTAVQELGDQLDTQAGRIEDAVSGISNASDVVSAVSTITSSLTAMSTDLSSTASELASLPGESQWNEAFAQSQECDQLTNG